MVLGNQWSLWINVIVGLILLSEIYAGYKNGVLATVFGLFSFFFMLILAYYLAPVVAKQYSIFHYVPNLLKEYLELVSLSKYVDVTVWFIALTIGLKFLFSIFYHSFKKLHHVPIYHGFSALLGALVGLVKGAVLCFVVSMILQSGLFVNGTNIHDRTLLAPLKTYSEKVVEKTFQSKWFSDLKLDVKQLPSIFPRKTVE